MAAAQQARHARNNPLMIKRVAQDRGLPLLTWLRWGAPALPDAPLPSAATQAELSKAPRSHHTDICNMQT